jgi:2-polyprenyl-6-methoxyphenol hydroxylase-like FAD-dependent oxidoreductase
MLVRMSDTNTFDAIVVGARCGGAATAMLLARRGHRVLLVDRATFPSDMPLSNHLVWPPGVAALDRWGLRDELARTGCPALTSGTIDVGPFALTGRFPPAGGVAEAYAPRRRILDGILVEAATRAGAELWEGCTVDGLLRTGDGETVRGIRGRVRGHTVEATAAIVVGADGMRSTVARMVDAPTYHERPARQGIYFTYWSGVPVADAATLYSRPYRSVVTVPTHDGLTVVSISLPVHAFRAARADIAGHYARTLDEVAPELAEQVRAGRREERWIGAATPGFFRRPHGRGWALVGDAGYVKDPCTAQGISDAFHHAELLAGAIDTGLRDPEAMHAALVGYEQRRNDAVMAMYEFTWQRSALEPPTPQMQQLLLALRDDPTRTELFFGVFTGSVSPTDFFAAPAQQPAA